MYDYPADKELNFYFLPGCFRLLLSADNQNANSLDAIKSGPNKVISETQQQQLTKSTKGVPECKIGKLVNTFLQSRLFSSLFNPFSRHFECRTKHPGTKHPMPFFATPDKTSRINLPPRTKHPMQFLSPRTKHPMPFLPPRTKHPMLLLPPRIKHPTLCL